MSETTTFQFVPICEDPLCQNVRFRQQGRGEEQSFCDKISLMEGLRDITLGLSVRELAQRHDELSHGVSELLKAADCEGCAELYGRLGNMARTVQSYIRAQSASQE